MGSLPAVILGVVLVVRVGAAVAWVLGIPAWVGIVALTFLTGTAVGSVGVWRGRIVS